MRHAAAGKVGLDVGTALPQRHLVVYFHGHGASSWLHRRAIDAHRMQLQPACTTIHSCPTTQPRRGIGSPLKRRQAKGLCRDRGLQRRQLHRGVSHATRLAAWAAALSPCRMTCGAQARETAATCPSPRPVRSQPCQGCERVDAGSTRKEEAASMGGFREQRRRKWRRWPVVFGWPILAKRLHKSSRGARAAIAAGPASAVSRSSSAASHFASSRRFGGNMVSKSRFPVPVHT